MGQIVAFLKDIAGTVASAIGIIPVVGPVIGNILKVIINILSAVFDFFGAIGNIFGFIKGIFAKLKARFQAWVAKRKAHIDKIKKIMKSFFTALYKIFGFLFRAFKRLFIFLVVIFQSVFGFLFLTIHDFFKYALISYDTGPKVDDLWDKFIIYATIFFESLRATLFEIFKTLVIISPVILVITVGLGVLIGIFYLLSLNPTTFIGIIYSITTAIDNVLPVILTVLNAGSNFLMIVNPLYNDTLHVIVSIFHTILSAIHVSISTTASLTSQTVSTVVLQDVFNILDVFYQFLILNLNLITALFQIVAQFGHLIYTIMEELLCPGGTCSTAICMAYDGGVTQCSYSIIMSINWLFSIFTAIIQFVFPIVLATIDFIIDIGGLLLSVGFAFGSLIGIYFLIKVKYCQIKRW